MNQIRYSPKLITGIILFLFVIIALYLRVVFPYHDVFSSNWIKFTTNDAYYFMRQIDNLTFNFPHLFSFDPYMRYPVGLPSGRLNLFVYLLSGIIWLVGLGSPTQHTVDVVSVYFPAVVGALTVIPVYFIGKTLFNRWAGVMSAGLVILLPGEFLGLSILGFTDRSAIETLLTAVTLLFVILAVKEAREKPFTFSCLKQREWTVNTKPFIYSLLAGIFLGSFLLTWTGAYFLVLVILVYSVVQFVIDHLRRQSTDYLCFVNAITLFIALIVTLLGYPSVSYLAPLIITLVVVLISTGVSRLMVKREIKAIYYPLALLGLAIVGTAIFHTINPSLLNSMLGNLSHIFFQSPAELTVSEQRPILFPINKFSLSAVWFNYTTSSFISLISLGILIFYATKQNKTENTLLIVWSLLALAFTLAMRRFALLFTLNVGLLSGYFSWLILKISGLKETIAEPVKVNKMAKKKGRSKSQRPFSSYFSARRLNLAYGVMIVFFLVFLPNIISATGSASKAHYAPSDAWSESLTWMKDNTPDPFGNPDFYYDLYTTPFHYPESAYGVVSWWDYGYWIIRTGHRLPDCDPGGGARENVAYFFTAQDEVTANQIINKLKSKYVIIDYPTVAGKFHGVATYARRSVEEFFDTYYYQQQGNNKVPVTYYYPEYYHSLAIMLYNFNGSDVTPQSTTVISYIEKTSQDSMRYKEVISKRSFSTYKEAEDYILKQKSGNYKIVSDNPFISPIPLQALEHYKLIHNSDNLIKYPGVDMTPEVKIFEYIK